MTRALLAALLSTAFAMSACQNNAATNNGLTTAEDLDATNMPASTAAVDAAFVTEAMKGDNSEVALGKLAAGKASAQDVKDLGDMLASDHALHKQEVAALAQQAGIPVTDDLKDEAKAEETKLNGLSGAEFDKEFVRATIEAHQKDIAKYEQQAKSGDPQTAALANKTLPTLRKHLDTAQGVQK